MAMPPPRSSKRRTAPPRWLVIPFVLTIIALLVDASVQSRSPKVQATLSSEAWVGKVLPYITASTAEGREISQVLSNSLQAGPNGASGELNKVAAAAASTYRSVADGDPPGEVAAAAGLLDACLAARKQGAAEMAIAVQDLLKGGSSSAAVSSMSSAVSDFQVGDSAYQLFSQDMPRLGTTMPASTWVSPGTYQESSLTAFVQRLVGGLVKQPSQSLTIDAMSTTPPPLNQQGKLEVLSPASSFAVTVVVADTTSSALQGVTVSVSVAPAEGSATQQLSATVDLSPGQAKAVTLSGLKTPESTPAVVTASATMPGATQPSVTQQLQVELPGPNYPGTSAPATTTPSATTTAPATTSSVLTSTATTT